MTDPGASYGIVFYSEGGSYAPYLRPIIEALADVYTGTVYYLSSDPADPLVLSSPSHVRGFYIGQGSARTYVLNNMRADVVAMTMPDMNTFHIKRSPKVAHYTYLHHSMVSTHMIYRKGAFDHFDSILCVGPHHHQEIREWEASRGLPAKQLFDHGYPPLDALLAVAAENPAPSVGTDGRLNILLAPSWGPQGILETRAEEVVKRLLEAGHFVRVRPHPQTRQLSGSILNALSQKFEDHPRFDMNEDTTKYEALFQSHVMISDWSGVAMEFAFGLERPVLFIDVPRKINNPDYELLASVPLEASYREQVGRIIDPERLDDLPASIEALYGEADLIRTKVRDLRGRQIFNIGQSGKQGAEILKRLAAHVNDGA